MEELAMKLEDVSYIYDDETFGLKHASLEIEKGKTVVVLGSNGSGKSTLLKILDGLYSPAEGKFYAFGKEVTAKKLRDRVFNKSFRERVSLLFQDTEVQLFSPTVEDEIGFGLRQMGLEEDKVRQKIDNITEFLGISELKKRYPYSLSGGEKRKTAIASVLCLNSEVYLLDEPTANIDPQTESRLIDLIVSMKEEGKTLIVSTQDILLAEHVADYVLFLDRDKRIAGFKEKETAFSDLDFLYKLGLLHAHKKIHKLISSYIHAHYGE